MTASSFVRPMIEDTEDYAKSQETDDIQGPINNAAMGLGILAWVHGVVEVQWVVSFGMSASRII